MCHTHVDAHQRDDLVVLQKLLALSLPQPEHDRMWAHTAAARPAAPDWQQVRLHVPHGPNRGHCARHTDLQVRRPNAADDIYGAQAELQQPGAVAPPGQSQCDAEGETMGAFEADRFAQQGGLPVGALEERAHPARSEPPGDGEIEGPAARAGQGGDAGSQHRARVELQLARDLHPPDLLREGGGAAELGERVQPCHAALVAAAGRALLEEPVGAGPVRTIEEGLKRPAAGPELRRIAAGQVDRRLLQGSTCSKTIARAPRLPWRWPPGSVGLGAAAPLRSIGQS